jgi:ABC-2 type transport system ATP-binding protein
MVAEGSLNEIYRQLQLMRVVHIRADNAGPELYERVRAIPGVESVEQQVDRWALRLREEDLSIADLHAGLVAAGARLTMLQPEAMDMETAFMKLTEGKTA